jgi:hypothetical protein
LAARLDALEAPRRAEEHKRELVRLQGEAAEAQARLPELARRLDEMHTERAEAERKLAEMERTVAEERAAVAQLGMRELPVEREIAGCWAAIAAARDAARPAPAVVPPHKWAGDAFQSALRRIFGLSLMPKRKAAPVKAGPTLRAGETAGALVKFAANTIAGGVSRLAGEEGIVTVADADVLVRAGKAVVLQTGVVVPPEKPYAIRNVGPTPVSVDGATVPPNGTVMVGAETWKAVCDGIYAALAPADGDVQRMEELQRRAAELGVE